MEKIGAWEIEPLWSQKKLFASEMSTQMTNFHDNEQNWFAFLIASVVFHNLDILLIVFFFRKEIFFTAFQFYFNLIWKRRCRKLNIFFPQIKIKTVLNKTGFVFCEHSRFQSISLQKNDSCSVKYRFTHTK